MANLFSRWIPATLPFLDTHIKLKLRAFDKREAPEFKRAVQARFENILKRDDESEAEHEKRSAELLADFNALAKSSFARYVKVAEPLQDADDETVVIADGASLFDQASSDFVMSVMLKLAELASLGDTEGKSSGSLSTSPVDPASPTSASPVSNTAVVACPSPSTATAPTLTPASSTEAA